MSERKRVGIIDIGSMKTKVTAAEFSGDLQRTVLLKERALTNLSSGLNDLNNLISSQSMEVQVEVLVKYLQMLGDLGIEDVRIIGTEALRKAGNSGEVVQTINALTRNNLEILSPREEAEAFFGIVSNEISGDLVIADVGGGSVQITFGEKGILKEMHLIKTGTMTLRGGEFKSHFPSAEELNGAKSQVIEELARLGLKKSPDSRLIYGSTNIEDFFREAGIGSDKAEQDDKTVFSASAQEVKDLYDIITQYSFEDRAKFFPSEPFFMWGADMSLINIIVLSEMVGIDRIIPTNLNISDGLLLSLVNNND